MKHKSQKTNIIKIIRKRGIPPQDQRLHLS